MAVQARELRIGNLVYFHENFIEVTEVRTNSVFYAKNTYALFEECEPIPLTPDILLRAGFEKSETDMIDSKESFSIQIGNTCSLYFTEGDWYISLEWVNHTHGHFFWAQPKYLHLLQNLFFALTDTELEINL